MKKYLGILFALVLALSFSLMPAAPAAADTLNVGSGETYTTIQAAINAATADDTIIVAAGTYDELLTISVDGLTLLGAQAGVDPRPMSGGRSGNESIIRKTYTIGTLALNPIKIEASNVTINGFTISPHYGAGVGGEGGPGLNKDLIKQEPLESNWVGTTIKYNILTATGYNIVDNCDELVQLKGVTGAVIEYNYGYHDIGTDSGGNAFNIADGSADSVIRYNEAHGCGDFQYDKWGGAIYTYESANISVIGNKVVGGGGITFGASKATGDAAWPPMRNVGGTVEGNIVENATFGLEIFADDVTVLGNDATGCGEYALNIIGSNVTVQGNNLCNSGTGILVEDKATVTSTGVSINANNIYGNTFGLKNLAAEEVDAILNWWGNTTGPHHTTNPSGTGDPVSDYVNFTPWLTGPWTGSSVGMIANVPDIVAISVDPTSIDFGILIPGATSTVQDIDVQNIGTRTVDVTAHISGEAGDLFFSNLKLRNYPAAWGNCGGAGNWNDIITDLGMNQFDTVNSQLSVPSGYTPSGPETATLAFIAEAK